MTREDYLKKSSDLLASIRAGVKAYNDAYGKKLVDKMEDINAQLEKDVDEYNRIAQTLCFDECATTDDPMRAAILKLAYRVVDVRDITVGEMKTPVRTVIGDPADPDSPEKWRNIDLLALDKYVRERGGEPIGADPNWRFMAERLNMLFALDCAVEIGKLQPFLDEMSDCYAMKKASKDIDLGAKNPREGTPISNNGLRKALEAVVTAMLGEEDGHKVMTHDVRFLKRASAKKSKKALTLQCANHRAMRGYIMEVCHRIITDGVYDAEYKHAKKREK